MLSTEFDVERTVKYGACHQFAHDYTCDWPSCFRLTGSPGSLGELGVGVQTQALDLTGRAGLQHDGL